MERNLLFYNISKQRGPNGRENTAVVLLNFLQSELKIPEEEMKPITLERAHMIRRVIS